MILTEKVDSIISKIRNEQFGKWTNMTMTVDNEGNMQTDFDYTDLSEYAFQYKKEWKKKYLQIASPNHD